MKKTVIITLIILPIVLLISIAVAGKFRSTFQPTLVERVEFIDEDFGTVYEYDDVFEVPLGETRATKIRFTPREPDNKEVTYTVAPEHKDICTVDKDGVIYGASAGRATVTVTTKDGGRKAYLQVYVNAEKVTGVFLPFQELALSVGESFKLTPTVQLPQAMDKTVSYQSSDENVCKVDVNGNLSARAEGNATITVTTNDGGFTATCDITVASGNPTLKFDFTGADFLTLINKENNAYETSQATVDLNEYLIVDTEKIDEKDIVFSITTGKNNCTLEDGVLTLKKNFVKIKVYVKDTVTLAYQAEIIIALPTEK